MAKIASQLNAITAELKEASWKSTKAPKKWWDKMIKTVKGKDKAAVVGKIWADLPESKKKTIREREGKEFGKPKKKSKESALEKDTLFVVNNKGEFLQGKRWVKEFPDADTWEDGMLEYKKAEQAAKDNSGILKRTDKDGNEEDVLDFTEENVKVSSLLRDADLLIQAASEDEINTFIEQVKAEYKKEFPKGWVKGKFSSSFGLPTATFWFGIFQEDKIENHIAQNDAGYSVVFVNTDTFEVTSSVTGRLAIKPEEGSHFAFGALKVGWRNKKCKDLNDCVKYLATYFVKLKKTVVENKDKFYPEDQERFGF